jgi:hypothetical protein
MTDPQRHLPGGPEVSHAVSPERVQVAEPAPYLAPGHPGGTSALDLPTAARKRLKTGVLAAAVVALLVVFCGGTLTGLALIRSDMRTSGSVRPNGSSAAGTSTGRNANAAGSDHSGDLRQLVVPAPPDSKPWGDDAPGTDGLLSLDQAAGRSTDTQTMSQMLQRYGFKRGAVRAWLRPDGAALIVKVLQFDSPAHASQFADHVQAGTRKESGAMNITSIPGVPGGMSFTNPDNDANGYVSAQALASRGDTYFVVAVGQLPPLDIQNLYTLTREQYDRL